MKIKRVLCILALAVGTCAFFPSPIAQAVDCGIITEADPNANPPTQAVYYQLKDGEKCCDGVVTTTIECDATNSNGITQLLLKIINLLTAAVVIASVGGVIWGSILYTTAGGDQAKTKKAITVITDVVIGLVAFAAMWAVLNFLIPGGVFA